MFKIIWLFFILILKINNIKIINYNINNINNFCKFDILNKTLTEFKKLARSKIWTLNSQNLT